MANVVEEGAAPSSNIVGGAPTATKTFTMPASVALDVQSVVATIDNSAGATPVTATVTIRDQGGEVIDANAQDDTIPAGGTGTATFARRLVDNHGGIRFGKGNTGTWLVVHTSGTAPVPPASSGGAGIEMVATGAGVYAEGTFVFFTSSGDTEVDAGRDFNVNTARDETHIITNDVQYNAANFFVAAVAANGLIEFDALEAGGNFVVQVGHDITMLADRNIHLSADAVVDVDAHSATFGFSTDSQIISGGEMLVQAATDVQLASGSAFVKVAPTATTIRAQGAVTVQDSGGNPIFRVDNNGDLHGKTGKALVFDL